MVILSGGNLLTETRGYVPGTHLPASLAIPGVSGFSYTYDAVQRKTTEGDASRNVTQSFGYDDGGRLTSWSEGVTNQAWTLTPVGDWTSTTRNGAVEARQHSAVHEATQVGSMPLSYDVQGNLTVDERQTALAWDPENRLVRAQVRPASSSTGLGAIATYRYDALGRRVSQTVHDVRTLYLHGGAQVLAEVIRPALPEASQLAGGTDPDGSVANAALPPASGGVLPTSGPGAVQQRINFQPETVAIPSGFHGDRGLAFGVRSNGLSYGWDAANTGDARVRRGVSRLVEADTLIHFAKTVPRSWSIALPNGIYPVVVVAGDAAYRDQIDNLQIGGELVIDPDPNGGVAGGTGDFDGYAVLAHVTDGRMTISMGYGGSNAKICWVEIGSAVDASYTIPQSVHDRLAAMVQQASAMTATTPEVVQGEREFVYGSYVDEVVAYQQTVNGVSSRYYPHYNHLYSPAALTDHSGSVVERYSYTAFGAQTITAPTGAVRAKSAVGFDRSFTGMISDSETALLFGWTRWFSPSLGRWVNRDGLDYVDGWSLYEAYFVPNYLDPTGAKVAVPPNPKRPNFGQEVLAAFKAVIGDCADLSIGADGVIQISNEKESCKCDPCWKKLKALLTNDPLITINYVPGRNEMNPEGTGVSVDPEKPVDLPVGENDADPDSPTLERSPFAITLWHEVVGHGTVKGPEGSHPGGDENGDPNRYGTGQTPQTDKVIAVENEGRVCYNINLPGGSTPLKPRLPGYYGPGRFERPAGTSPKPPRPPRPPRPAK